MVCNRDIGPICWIISNKSLWLRAPRFQYMVVPGVAFGHEPFPLPMLTLHCIISCFVSKFSFTVFDLCEIWPCIHYLHLQGWSMEWSTLKSSGIVPSTGQLKGCSSQSMTETRNSLNSNCHSPFSSSKFNVITVFRPIHYVGLISWNRDSILQTTWTYQMLQNNLKRLADACVFKGIQGIQPLNQSQKAAHQGAL